MLFDTHCHLNFSAFDPTVDNVITDAKKADVTHIVVPGTDIESSKKAISIAKKHEGMYAAVGIHPHHVYELLSSVIPSEVEGSSPKNVSLDSSVVKQVEGLLQNDNEADKIVAIGEVGLDRHIYQKTKYGEYQVNEGFMELQKKYLIAQLELAKKYKKSVIIHNREAKSDLLPLLHEHWDSYYEGKMVFHCCEPDDDLLKFVKEKKIFWGVDGDVTYPSTSSGQVNQTKADFIHKVPLEQLVLETDAPFLTPEPLKSQKVFPNKPENIIIIAEFVAKLREENADNLIAQTSQNAKRLFQVT